MLLAQLLAAFAAARNALRLPRWALAPNGQRYVLYLQEGPRDTERVVHRKVRQLPDRIALGPHSVHTVSLTPTQPLRVSCIAGAVWLTRDRDIRDYVLAAGAGQCVPAGRQVVIGGMPRGSVEIGPLSDGEIVSVPEGRRPLRRRLRLGS